MQTQRNCRSYWLLACVVLLTLSLFLQHHSQVVGQVDAEITPPSLVSPAQGEVITVQTYPPLAIPTYRWSHVLGATVYQLQVNTDPYFSLPNVIEALTPNLQVTPTDANVFPDGIYYWRVRVAEPLPGSLFSEPAQFSKSWASVDNRPLLAAPVSGAVLSFFDDPAFAWDQVSGAAQYWFQISSSPGDFSSPIYDVYTAALKHQPVEKIANGTYYWRVIPMDPAGHAGTPSEVRAITLGYGSSIADQIPQQVSPEHGASIPFTPTFAWTAVVGAEFYDLEYTSGPMCDFSAATSIQTQQTSYTPPFHIPKGIYCWRVRVVSGDGIGEWSEIRIFTLSWNLQPQLLTPVMAYPYARSALFNWTPVAGAAYYTIEVSETSNLDELLIQANTTNTSWVSQDELLPASYSWQVTAYDSSNQGSLTSVEYSFQNPLTATVPSLVYPGYYYDPDESVYAGDTPPNPATHKIAPYPLFIWQRVLNPAPYGGLLAHTYRIQVSQTAMFSTVEWEYDTQNTAASPTLDAPFSPQTGLDYYWRVCPLELTQPVCQRNPANGDEWWSQTWIARFDPALSIPIAESGIPDLLRPLQGHEQVEGTPVLEWHPVLDADAYHVQISRDSEFTTIAHEAYTGIPMYASPLSLAQRNLGLTDYGTFYWRVRCSADGNYSDWSETRRFQIASQSEWRRVRYLGNERNKLLVGSDPAGDTVANYDLTSLFISQSNTAWYLGFNANIEPAVDMTYMISIDTDHLDGAGGSSPPARSYPVTTIPAHQPEIVLYIDQVAGTLTAQNTYIYTWTGSGWSNGQTLSTAGGALLYTPGSPGTLELALPNTAIGASNTPGSMSVMVISIDSAGTVLDSVPTDPDVPGNAVLSRFTSISDRMNLISPANTIPESDNSIPYLVPMFWDWPTGSDASASDPAPATPFAGAQLQIALDPQFTILVVDHISEVNSYYVGTAIASVNNDLAGDATYYWRVRPRYLNAGIFFGAWSEIFSFSRAGFKPQNLRLSTQLATPEFRWDRVEGTAQYQLQLSTHSDFDILSLDITTPNPAYTPLAALNPGTYYWRVGALRQAVSSPVWSSVEQMTISLPIPGGLTPNTATQAFQSIPTLCWQPIFVYSSETPIASAWKYQLQVSKTSDFQTPVETTVTEMHCWSPQSWYPQGIYNWRVAMLDGSGNTSDYSAPAIFNLQYLVPSLVSPVTGTIFQTPDFSWTGVPGSAYYRLEVSLSADFYPLFDSIQTVNTQFTPLVTYPPGHVYYWRVAAFTPNGYQGGYVSGQITIGRPNVWLPMVRK